MLHSKIVLPTMVCVLDSTTDLEEMHRHYCVQPAKGKSCSPLRSWKGNEQPRTVCSSHRMRVTTVTSEL